MLRKFTRMRLKRFFLHLKETNWDENQVIASTISFHEGVKLIWSSWVEDDSAKIFSEFDFSGDEFSFNTYDVFNLERVKWNWIYSLKWFLMSFFSKKNCYYCRCPCCSFCWYCCCTCYRCCWCCCCGLRPIKERVDNPWRGGSNLNKNVT